MDYDLSRIDYTICGITFPDTMKILPAPGPRLLQKIAVGDKNGVLQCLSIKDEEPVVQFKSLPGKPITSVQLASSVSVETQTDKIFAASGNEVKGYTKKGKVFLTIETSLSETITSMCVVGADLILCSGRTVTYYRDLQEFQSYVCEDRVLDIAAFAVPNIAVGDKNGVLQCLSIKDEEPVVQFKSLPGKPITSVQLASSVSVETQTDKIFAASGNEVKGYTKKGKVFLTIETSLSETITSMCVVGADLILCSGRTVTYYRDLQEFQSYVCEDRVLDIAAFAVPNSTRVRLLVLIANKGAALLEGGQIITKTAISAGPCRLAVLVSFHGGEVSAFYGAADGSIGLISYEESLLSNQRLLEGRGFGSVVCLGWFLGNAGTHLAVGRNDGSVQLYLIDINNLAEKPRLKFTYFCGEPVTSVSGGCVGTEDNELVVATFSGRIFALRSQRLIPGSVALANIPHDALAARRSKLESEVVRLEKQVANERDKYQKSTRSLHAGLSTPPLLDIQYELNGATQEGWQEARIMAAVPLDMLFIYCNRKISMQTDTAAVLSVCPPQGKDSDLLATVRCQAGTRRLWIRMKCVPNSFIGSKAESVKVLVYALPAGAPRVARLITLRLPALPYYSQHEDADFDMAKRSWSQLRVSGKFSVAEMTSWLADALPGELPKPATNVIFGRRHTLLGTILVCQYQRRSAVFKSDNISTIATIRDILSYCSLEKSISVEISCDIPEDCCVKCFNQIEDQFRQQYQKNQDINLKKAISQLDLDTDKKELLCKEYLRVWEMESVDDKTDLHFDELVDMVGDWYLDWKALSLHTSDGTEKVQLLRDALRDCQLDKVVKILANEPLSPLDYYQ